MNKIIKLLCAVSLLLLLALPAMAETETPATEVTYGGLTVSSDSTYVDLGDIVVKDYDQLCEFLDQLPQLEQFDMFSTLIQRTNIEMLAERYPNVKFGWTMYIPCERPHKIRTDATAFGTQHNNKIKGHTSEDFSILKYCTQLEALDIGHNNVTDLSFLYYLPNLKVLIIAANKVTDITPIGTLTQLQYLEIFKNKITDISVLANCTELIDLNICFNNISDWECLKGLTKLERLWLYNSNNYSTDKPVSKTVVAGLKEALPDCHIDSTHYSTNGGWRTHQRYDTILKIFKDQTYYPFES